MAYTQPGSTLTLTAPRAVTVDDGVLVGSIFGVSLGTYANGAEGEFSTEGVHALAKTSAQAWTVGARIYWDNTAFEATTDSAAGQLIGTATEVADNPSSTGRVKLLGNAPATAEGPQAAIADLTDNSGGAVADGTIAAVTAAASITDSSGGVDPGDDTIAAITNASNAGSADVLPTAAAIAQLAAKANTTRSAVIALTDAVTELSTKLNATLAALRAAGIIAAS